MLTLALDTATKVCAVGLVKDGRVVAEYDISVGPVSYTHLRLPAM